MAFSESTNWHDAIAPGEEIGKAERQLDAAISNITGGSVNTSGIQVVYIATSTGTVANSATEGTVIGSSGVGSLDLPADFFAEGVVLRVTARGYYSSVAGTANLRMRMKLGSTIVLNTGDFAPPTTSNQYWEISALITCRSDGASGTLMPSGHMSYDDGAGQGMIETSVKSLDTTAQQTFDLTADWDAADASNKVVCTNLLLEKLQVGNASLSPSDVTVEFDTDASTAASCAATHDVDVVLSIPSGGQIASDVTVDWSATNANAPTSGTVTFPAGSGNGAVQTITVAPDYTDNPVLTLSNASSNATLGSETTHEVTLSGDWEVTFDFTAESGSSAGTVYGDTWTITSPGAGGTGGSYVSGTGYVGEPTTGGAPNFDTVNVVLTIDSSIIEEIQITGTASAGSGNNQSDMFYTINGSVAAIFCDNCTDTGDYDYTDTQQHTGVTQVGVEVRRPLSGSVEVHSIRLLGSGPLPSQLSGVQWVCP